MVPFEVIREVGENEVDVFKLEEMALPKLPKKHWIIPA